MNDEFDDFWFLNQTIIQDYFERKPLFESLCSEVVYILKKRLKDAGIETALVISRVKTLNSFLGKIERKNYRFPFQETTDLAGVRVVYLYKDDLNKIKEVVNRNLKVVEEVDKTQNDVDRFGYEALHYLVEVDRKTSGARYEDLKNLVCEVQVRTVLQDSWAIIDHHLRYKTESQVPRLLRRQIHRLAAILEEADEKFSEISKERTKYIEWLYNENTSIEAILNEELNQDSLVVYLKKKFPNYSLSDDKNYKYHLNAALRCFDFDKYRTIKQIDEIIDRTENSRKLYKRKNLDKSSLAHFSLSIGCIDKIYRQGTNFNDIANVVFEHFDSN